MSFSGATHDAGTTEPARRIHIQRLDQDHRRDQPRRHPRPGAAPLRPHRPQDRVPAAGGGGPCAHSADPLSQDECQLRGEYVFIYI